MSKMPGAAWKPLGSDQAHQPLIDKVDGIILHTAVGSLYSTDGYFMHGNGEGYIGTESHFIVGAKGEIWQITDTARTADANLDGNNRLLSIETADSGEGFPAWSGSNVPAWLPAQVEALARIVAWAAGQYNFPLERMPDSLSSRRGVGYHRLGIDPWRVAGGELWSTSGGKVCPGDRRVAQIDDIIRLALTGAKPPWPQYHEQSPAVRQMQARLRANEYPTGKDRAGFYGAGTKAAIVRLQRAYDDTKADADGIIGPLTWAHIEALPDPPQEPPVDPPNKPLAEAWQKATGDTIRTSLTELEAGEAYVTAHPNMPALKALHDEQIEAHHAEQIRWQKLHVLATP